MKIYTLGGKAKKVVKSLILLDPIQAAIIKSTNLSFFLSNFRSMTSHISSLQQSSRFV